MTGWRSASRLEDLGLALLEFGLADDPAITQVGQLGELVGGAAAPLRRVPDVGAHGLVSRLGIFDIPFGHLVAARDQVYEDAQERQDDHEDQPAGLTPAAQVPAPEDVQDDPEQNEEPQDPQEEPQHGQERVR